MIREQPLPSSSPTLSRLRLHPLAFAVVPAALVLIVLSLPSLIGARWYADEGVFAAVSQAWRDGGVLYDDTWDNKPPLIFFTYAAPQAILGDSLVSVRLLAMLSALGAVVLAAVMGARLCGHARGAVAGVIAALLLGSPVIEANLALTETFMILPAAAGMFLTLTIVSRDGAGPPRAPATGCMLGAGICFGIAMGYKQVAALDLAAAGLALLLLHPHPRRMIACLLAGAAIPQAAFLLYFVATGAAGGYLYAVIGSMPAYAAAVENPKPLWASLIGYGPGALAVAYAVVNRRSFGLRDVPLVWLGLAFTGAASSPYAFPHYLVQAAVPCAVALAGLALPRRAPPAGPHTRAPLARAAITLATIAVALAVFAPEITERRQSNPRWYYTWALAYARGDLTRAEYEGRLDGGNYAIHDIEAAMKQDDRGDTLYQWADFPWLYTVADTRNPTPYATPWLVQWVPGAEADVIDDLRADPPAYIVISDNVDAFAALEQLVEQDYALVEASNDWHLYGLQSTPGRSD